MIVIVFLATFCGTTLGLSCGPGVVPLRASHYPQTLFSPGYPEDYDNNENCSWVISVSSPGPRMRVQVEVVLVDLANWDGGPCEDFLVIWDWQDDQYQYPALKGKWCDSAPYQVKSKGGQILVRFVTDQHITAPGFALKYYEIEDYDAQCDPYNVRTLAVGSNPLYLDLPMYRGGQNRREVHCDYHFKSTIGDDVTMTLEILNFGDLLCEDGKFTFYDGSSTSSPVLLDWCHANQPAHRVISSNKDMFLRFTLYIVDTNVYVFRAKVSTTTKRVSCSDSAIPTILVEEMPTILAFPLQRNSYGDCPLRLWADKQSQSVRLEVISPDLQCGDDPVRLIDGYDGSAPALGTVCDQKVFGSSAHNLVVLGPSRGLKTPVFFKVSALEATCNNKVHKLPVASNTIMTLHLLKSSSSVKGQRTVYSHNLNCSHLLQADRSSEVIEVKVSGDWSASGGFSCTGDSVTFYDGASTKDPVLAVWCGLHGQDNRFISTGAQMLVKVVTDDHGAHLSTNLTYYSVPRIGRCEKVTELKVNKTVQTLYSPNYPLYYPINSHCEYKLKSSDDRPIRLEVVSSIMERDCSDTVVVYNGLERDPDNHLGRWCGDDRPTFTSEGPEMLVVFTADLDVNDGKFEARYYSVDKEGKGMDEDYLIPAIIGSLLFAIAFSVIVIVLYIFISKKGRQQN